MAARDLNPDEITTRGQRLFNEKINPTLGPKDGGKFVVINVDTGDFEIDKDDLAASKRAKSRFPGSPLFVVRVGAPAAYRLGGRFQVTER